MIVLIVFMICVYRVLCPSCVPSLTFAPVVKHGRMAFVCDSWLPEIVPTFEKTLLLALSQELRRAHEKM